MNLFECINLMHRMGTMDETTYGRALHKENLLTEADSRLKKVIAIIRKYFSSVLNPEARVTDEEYYVNNNPNTTWEQYILYNLRHTFGLMSNADVALLPAVAEIAYGDCGFGLEEDPKKITMLENMIPLIKKDEPFLETFKKGGVTFEQLQERYGATLADKARADQEKMDKTEYTRNTDYTIIPISTMAEAYEYGKDSGVNGSGQLCFTTNESMWGTFTNNGKNKCYCILRKDYKNIPCERGEGYPKDNYGLSMIFVFVSPWGELTNSNVRWNHGHHDFSKVDNMFTKSEISEIIGQRFNDAFNCKDGEKRLEQEALQNGKSNGVVLYYDSKGYLIDGNGRLKRSENGDLLVFDYIDDFNDGFAKVKLNGEWNFIDRNGNLLSRQWFGDAGDFSDGFAIVVLNNRWNFIGADGNYLSEQWFDEAYPFDGGIAIVYLDYGKYNYIDEEGNLLSKQWFDFVSPFHEGFAIAKLDGRYNLIDRNGNLLSEQWFNFIGFFRDGFAGVKLNGKYNFIGTDGNYLSKQWFDEAYSFSEGIARVILDEEYNFIDEKGNFLSEQWFDDAYDFSEGFAKVVLNNKYNFIDRNGNYIGEQWFDKATFFKGEFAEVKLNGTWYRIDTNGKFSLK